MGQINNDNNQVLKLKSIENDIVKLLVYENDKELLNSNVIEVYVPDLEKYILESVITKLGDSYKYSSTNDNWAFLQRKVRMIMTREFVETTLLSDNHLATIINREIKKNAQAQNKFIFKGRDKIIVYFNKIDDADYVVVEPYIINGDIKIETHE